MASMAQQGFPLPWGLHYHHHHHHHREASPRRAGGAGPAVAAAAPTQLYRHPDTQMLLDAQAHPCKGDPEERGGGGGGGGFPRELYHPHAHTPLHRDMHAHTHIPDHELESYKCASAGAAGAARAVGASDEDAVTSSQPQPARHWDKMGGSASVACAERAEASSPHQLVSTTGSASGGRRGALQLWQFLVALLAEGARCVAWTGRGLEFKLHEPEEVARRWGAQKNRPAMNYDKLSRSLRYYYEKGIMQKVAGERYVYKFVCDPEALFSMAAPRARSPPPPPAPSAPGAYDVLTQLYGVYPPWGAAPAPAPDYRRYPPPPAHPPPPPCPHQTCSYDA